MARLDIQGEHGDAMKTLRFGKGGDLIERDEHQYRADVEADPSPQSESHPGL